MKSSNLSVDARHVLVWWVAPTLVRRLGSGYRIGWEEPLDGFYNGLGLWRDERSPSWFLNQQGSIHLNAVSSEQPIEHPAAGVVSIWSDLAAGLLTVDQLCNDLTHGLPQPPCSSQADQTAWQVYDLISTIMRWSLVQGLNWRCVAADVGVPEIAALPRLRHQALTNASRTERSSPILTKNADRLWGLLDTDGQPLAYLHADGYIHVISGETVDLLATDRDTPPWKLAERLFRSVFMRRIGSHPSVLTPGLPINSALDALRAKNDTALIQRAIGGTVDNTGLHGATIRIRPEMRRAIQHATGHAVPSTAWSALNYPVRNVRAALAWMIHYEPPQADLTTDNTTIDMIIAWSRGNHHHIALILSHTNRLHETALEPLMQLTGPIQLSKSDQLVHITLIVAGLPHDATHQDYSLWPAWTLNPSTGMPRAIN